MKMRVGSTFEDLLPIGSWQKRDTENRIVEVVLAVG